MSTPPNVHVDNREAHIGMQVVAERVFFGGKEPALPEREALQRQISQHFAEALRRGELSFDASMEIGEALERLLGARGKWLETPGCRLASVEVEDDDREDLRLPLELLRPPAGAEPVLVRCALAKSETAPEAPRGYPEGGRIVLATADAGGLVPDEALRQALHDVCRTGLHLTSGSEHDRKRGAFDPEFDHLPRVSLAALRQALGPRDARPGPAVQYAGFLDSAQWEQWEREMGHTIGSRGWMLDKLQPDYEAFEKVANHWRKLGWREIASGKEPVFLLEVAE